MNLFALRERPAFVGVIHLLPLPGAPEEGPGIERVEARAIEDAATLVAGGADGIIVENLGDAPFVKDQVAPVTVAAMTRIALAVRATAPKLSLGINVLRNDAAAALGIAATVGAQFIRVNVHTGAMLTDQGWIEGKARDTLLARRLMGADQVRIAADVLVKHAVSPAPQDLASVARDTALRGLADALIVSGSGTGQPTDPGRIATVRAAVPHVPVWVGSGVTPEIARDLKADTAIVGTWLHVEGNLERPLDLQRVRAIREALDRSQGSSAAP